MPNSTETRPSIILPANNEADNLALVLPELTSLYPDAELIVVDDGSTDTTADVARQHGAHVVTHPYRMGNGAAVKTGARAATRDVFVFMDADGQHKPEDVRRLLHQLGERYDMVVGARKRSSHASLWRGLANSLYNKLASWITNQAVLDLTSGFRAVRAERFLRFLYLLPNGFSYPTTITMAFFRAGFAVCYLNIEAPPRGGASHIRPLQDGIRFLVIIFRVGTLYSPLKVFIPASLLFFLTGAGYYAHTFVTEGRFTNMSALLLITSILTFLMGLISEQISNLLYASSSR